MWQFEPEDNIKHRLNAPPDFYYRRLAFKGVHENEGMEKNLLLKILQIIKETPRKREKERKPKRFA